jgi:hypothetical protein
MEQARIDFCVQSKRPILFPTGNKWILCLVCRNGTDNPKRINAFIQSYGVLHKKCIAEFDSVKSMYETVPKSKLPKPVTKVVTETPTNVIVSETKIDPNPQLLLRIKELEAQLLEAQKRPPPPAAASGTSACQDCTESETLIAELKNDLREELKIRKQYKDMLVSICEVIEKLQNETMPHLIKNYNTKLFELKDAFDELSE